MTGKQWGGLLAAAAVVLAIGYADWPDDPMHPTERQIARWSGDLLSYCDGYQRDQRARYPKLESMCRDYERRTLGEVGDQLIKLQDLCAANPSACK